MDTEVLGVKTDCLVGLRDAVRSDGRRRHSARAGRGTSLASVDLINRRLRSLYVIMNRITFTASAPNGVSASPEFLTMLMDFHLSQY